MPKRPRDESREGTGYDALYDAHWTPPATWSKETHQTWLRAEIVHQFAVGRKKTTIAARLNVSRSLVDRWLLRQEETGDVLDESKERDKEPRVLAPQVLRQIKAIVDQGEAFRLSCFRDVADEMLRRHGVTLSKSSVRRALHEIDFKSIKTFKKPMELWTPEVQAKRLEYAARVITKPASYWDNVVFMDQSAMILERGGGWKIVPSDCPFAAEPKGHPQAKKIHFMAFIGGTLKSPIIFLEEGETWTGDTLKEKLNPWVKALKKSGHFFLMDNARAHLPLRTFLESHGITVLDHPAHSPDLNPIEHVWAWLKRMARKARPTDLDDLRERLMAAWKDFDLDDFRAYSGSMPDRLLAVVDADGGATKY